MIVAQPCVGLGDEDDMTGMTGDATKFRRTMLFMPQVSLTDDFPSNGAADKRRHPMGVTMDNIDRRGCTVLPPEAWAG